MEKMEQQLSEVIAVEQQLLTQVAGYRNSVASRSSDSCDRQLRIGGWA